MADGLLRNGVAGEEIMAEMLHRIAIQAPPSRVYGAITTADGLRAWWTRDASAEPKEGSVTALSFAGGDVVFRMKIDVLEQDRRVLWSCIGDWEEWTGTRLEWVIESVEGGGSMLHFAHSGWASTEKEFPVCNTNWGHLMHLLRDHAEGKPVTLLFPG